MVQSINGQCRMALMGENQNGGGTFASVDDLGKELAGPALTILTISPILCNRLTK
jgi:hypothetical protein